MHSKRTASYGPRPSRRRTSLRRNERPRASATVRHICGYVGALVAILARGAPLKVAQAAENAGNWYLLGLRGPGAGITPPPGLYFENDFVIYKGSAGFGVTYPLNGRFAAGLKGKAYAEFGTGLWVTPLEVLGGRAGVTVTVPYWGPEATVRAAAFAPTLGRVIGVGVSDSASFFGDPVVGSFIGWEYGKLHWQLGTAVNMPWGYYDRIGFANISLHRWRADTYASITWLDPELGIDLSTSVGVTFNGVNHFTDYHTGDEFHIDASASKYLTKDFSVGLLGYYYQQITGDSGQGAALGAFEGRVAGLGATASYTFHIGEYPISTRSGSSANSTPGTTCSMARSVSSPSRLRSGCRAPRNRPSPSRLSPSLDPEASRAREA
ncbi:Uncharacterized conserved protein [Rhizobiales bacterium GAS113]|nr:Uncharacterized conserved protein [Rhizobiales bacterium GAS113]